LRYYDSERDFQAGLQRAGGQPLPGQPRAVDLPVAMAAADAQRWIARAASAGSWARESLQWRTAVLDLAVMPGTVATAPGLPGRWRVRSWEWRDGAVELALERVAAVAGGAGAGDAGRASLAADRPLAPTALAAFELPWDGSGAGDAPALYAAVSSPGSGWTGAELGIDKGDGVIVALGPSGRARSVIGVLDAALPAAGPHLLDRSGVLAVALIGTDMALADASLRELAMGANRALVGQEIVQFARATALGGGRWRLTGLLRGRGGGEGAIAAHAAGTRFVLLDRAPVRLDPAVVGTAPGALVTALGLADEQAVTAEIGDRGATLRPLSPVHGRRAADGGVITWRWTRRARGAWSWPDAVDAPLHEQVEAYEAGYEQAGTVLQRWEVSEPVLAVPAAQWAGLRAAAPDGRLLVRQRGTYALSPALALAV
ncbi:MAG: hypothetical protein KGM17_15980, partial [Sphingomonadales bacterium]|nr:hypothetical protein [Sphingomonadales bacterium]